MIERQLMKAGRGAVCLLCMFVILATAGLVTADTTYGVDYARPVGGDYRYRTAKTAKPPESKNLWDYLSFFAWRGKKVQAVKPPAAESRALKARVRELAGQLVANSKESIAEEYVLTVDSFVNLNDLYKTSALGRYISEELMGDLQMAGIEVLDVRKSAGIMIHRKSGEYGLSRDMGELSYVHNAQAMVVGTYTYADGQIFLNARILNNADGLVMSHASLAFDLDAVTRQMLADEAAPPAKAGVVRVQQFSASESEIDSGE